MVTSYPLIVPLKHGSYFSKSNNTKGLNAPKSLCVNTYTHIGKHAHEKVEITLLSLYDERNYVRRYI